MSASEPSAPTEHPGHDMLVGICDFPSAYDFPPHGYGGIERWLWAVAVGAKRAGADVHLLGPKWRRDLDGFTRRPVRLEDLTDATASCAAHRTLRQPPGLATRTRGGHHPPLPPCRPRTWRHRPALECRGPFLHGGRSRHWSGAPGMGYQPSRVAGPRTRPPGSRGRSGRARRVAYDSTASWIRDRTDRPRTRKRRTTSTSPDPTRHRSAGLEHRSTRVSRLLGFDNDGYVALGGGCVSHGSEARAEPGCFTGQGASRSIFQPSPARR